MTTPMLVNLQHMFDTMLPLPFIPITKPAECKISSPEELSTFLRPAIRSKPVIYERFLEGPVRITYFDKRHIPRRFVLDNDELTHSVGNVSCTLAPNLVGCLNGYLSAPPFPEILTNEGGPIDVAVRRIALSDKVSRNGMKNKYYEAALESLKTYAKYVEGPSPERIDAAHLMERCVDVYMAVEGGSEPIYDTTCLKRNFKVLVHELMQAKWRD